MKAKNIYDIPIYEISKFVDFLSIDNKDKYNFILNNYDYLKNYIDVELAVTQPDKVVYDEINYSSEEYNDLKQEAKKILKDNIIHNEKEDICLALNPEDFNDDDEPFKGYPSFLFYNDEDIDKVKDKWLIYIGNDSLDIYKSSEFEVIEDLRYIGDLINISENTSVYNVAYTPEHFKNNFNNSIFYFLVFKGYGYEFNNDFDIDNSYRQVLFDTTKTKNLTLCYFKDNKFNVFSNKKGLNISSENISDIPGYLDKYDSGLFAYNDEMDGALNNLHSSLIKSLSPPASGLEDNGSFAHGSGGSKGIHSSKKPVTQMDPGGGSIKTWSSATEAANELGISRSSIVKAAKGQQSVAGGFRWKYA